MQPIKVSGGRWGEEKRWPLTPTCHSSTWYIQRPSLYPSACPARCPFHTLAHHTRQGAWRLLPWMWGYLVTVVPGTVILCPNLEFWYFRGSSNILRDNPKEYSFRTKASFWQWHENYWICHVFLVEARGSFEPASMQLDKVEVFLPQRQDYSMHWKKPSYFLI